LGVSHRRALINLAYQLTARDNYREGKRVDLEGLELSRKRGDRDSETLFISHLLADDFLLRGWEPALSLNAEIDEVVAEGAQPFIRLTALPFILIARGETDQARRVVDASGAATESSEVQTQVLHLFSEATVLRAEGRPLEALGAAERALAERE